MDRGKSLSHIHDSGRSLGAEMTVTDPVCGMQFPPEKAAGKCEYQGQTYYFCYTGCLEKFKAEPAKYLAPANASAIGFTQPAAASLYTCPMDPEIRQDTPGSMPEVRHGA